MESALPAGLSKLAYDVDEITKGTPFGRNTVYVAINSGDLVARKYGRRTVILHDDLVAWLRAMPLLTKEAA